MADVQPATRYHPIDARSLFIEDLTLTASGVIQEDAADKIVELGAGRLDADLMIDVSDLDISSVNELYEFTLQASDDPLFASGVQNLAILQLGHTSVRNNGAIDSVIGRYQVPFHNADAVAEYKYSRLHLTVAGLTPTITFSAWISPRL